MQNARFDATNPHFKNKYATLASILDTVREPLAEHAISRVQTETSDEHGNWLETRLVHASGQWIGSRRWFAPLNAKPQEYGSALTYARRYSLATLCGISADQDDDAEAATKGNGRAAVEEAVVPLTDEQISTIEAALTVREMQADRLLKWASATYRGAFAKISDLPSAHYQTYLDKIRTSGEPK
jgi:hypothetical protein